MADLTFMETRDRILYMLYDLGRTTGEIVLGSDEPYEAIVFEVPGANEFWCERAFDSLVEAKHVAREYEHFGFGGRSTISIALSGIEQVEARLNAPDSDMAELRASYGIEQEVATREVRDLRGDTREQRFLRLSLRQRGNVGTLKSNEAVPAADRIVTLDHNQPDVAGAVDTLDRLVEEVRSTNEFSGSAEEKERAVAELSALRRLLRASKVRVMSVLALASPVLGWVQANILNETTKELAKKFGDWLSKTFMN